MRCETIIMTFREKLPSILIYTITLVVLMGIVLYIQPRRVIDYLFELGFWGVFTLFLLLFLLYVVDIAIRIYRWKILLVVQGINLPLKSLTLPVVSALAINLFTIARAGETVRMYALKRRYSTKYSDTLSSIVIEQVLSIVGLLLVITGSLFFVGSSLLQIENSEIIHLFVTLLFLGSVVGLLTLSSMLVKPELIEKFIRNLPQFLEERVYSAYQSFLTGLKGLRSKPFHLSLGIITSASIWVIEGVMIYVIANTVFPSLDIIDFPWVIAASCAGNVTFIVPILPGSIGTYELVLALILINSPNYPGMDATLIALIDRVAKSVILVFFGGYATIRLGGMEIIRLRKDFSSIPNESNELENVQNVDINAKPPIIAEENSFIKN